MVNDEAVQKAAEVIAAKTTVLGTSTMRGLDRAILAARDLAEAGLLATAVLTEEVETERHAQWSGPVAVTVTRRRWVSEWEESKTITTGNTERDT